MQAYLPWIWLGLIALFGVLEGATLQLVSIWFCVGSFAALAASLLGAEAWLQFVVFAVVSNGKPTPQESQRQNKQKSLPPEKYSLTSPSHR